MALALPLYAVPLHWGLAGRQEWAFDEPTPSQIAPQALATREESWPRRYPPLHRYLLHGLIATALPVATASEPVLGVEAEALLHALGRALTVTMALATLLLVEAIARRLYGARAGWLAALLWLGVAPQAYYAKTMNLDAPYLFWFALALYFFVAFRSTGRSRDLVAFALAGGCAILTKDQAYGLFVLPALWLVVSVHRQRRAAGESFARAAWSTMRDARLVGAFGALAVLTAIVYRAWNGGDDFAPHFAEITGYRWMGRYRQVPATLAGQLGLAQGSLLGLLFCCGWFGFAAGAAGAVRELRLVRREPRRDRTGALLMLFALSYHLTFVAVIRFVYDRFLLPTALILSIVASALLAQLLDASRRRSARLASSLAVAVGLSYGIARAVAVDLSMLWDSRVVVERWTVGRGRVVAFGGLPSQYPRSFEKAWGTRFLKRPCHNLRDFDFVAFQPRVHYRSGEKRLLRKLESGAYGFRPVPVPRFEPPRWLYSVDYVVTNLRWIDQGVLLFERDRRLTCGAGTVTDHGRHAPAGVVGAERTRGRDGRLSSRPLVPRPVAASRGQVPGSR